MKNMPSACAVQPFSHTKSEGFMVSLMECWPGTFGFDKDGPKDPKEPQAHQGARPGATGSPHRTSTEAPKSGLRQQREVGKPGRFRLLPVRVLSNTGTPWRPTRRPQGAPGKPKDTQGTTCSPNGARAGPSGVRRKKKKAFVFS